MTAALDWSCLSIALQSLDLLTRCRAGLEQQAPQVRDRPGEGCVSTVRISRSARVFLVVWHRASAVASVAGTLVIGGRRDRVGPFDQSRWMAGLIPGSRLVPLDTPNHLLPERDPAWPKFLAELDAFLTPPQHPQ
jgi:pimeloyl-ACP methyl ester carboxylesterase